METAKNLVRVDLTENICIIDRIDLDGKASFRICVGWPHFFIARRFLQKLNKLLEA